MLYVVKVQLYKQFFVSKLLIDISENIINYQQAKMCLRYKNKVSQNILAQESK